MANSRASCEIVTNLPRPISGPRSGPETSLLAWKTLRNQVAMLGRMESMLQRWLLEAKSSDPVFKNIMILLCFTGTNDVHPTCVSSASIK